MTIEEAIAAFKEDLDVYPELVYLFAGWKPVISEGQKGMRVNALL